MVKMEILVKWGYAAEVILALLIAMLVFLLFGETNISNLLREHWSYISTMGGLGVALEGALTIYFFGLGESDFAKFLRHKQYYGHYMRAHKFQLTLFVLLAIIPFMASTLVHLPGVAFLTSFFVFYCSVNIFTAINNTFELVDLKNLFRDLSE